MEQKLLVLFLRKKKQQTKMEPYPTEKEWKQNILNKNDKGNFKANLGGNGNHKEILKKQI
jgi:hypothetical protein